MESGYLKVSKNSANRVNKVTDYSLLVFKLFLVLYHVL